ncbi:MAG: hypothetical protein PGN37_01185 [Mycobacterium kyogaense]|uniref:hypothetical protein n=1 Tax=Mycobacterium kyogaense TaxID=2212479 RepID=UPI002FF447A1
MPARVQVVPEDLHVSAATVDTHADAVKARHFAADARIEGAQKGVPAASVAALSGAVTKWQADTTAIFGQMVDHAHGLRTGAAAYVEADHSGATQVQRADQQISDVDLGL